MFIVFSGFGTIKPNTPIPADILNSEYPSIGATEHSDGSIWLHMLPYPEAYDESKIRQYLETLRPYLSEGRLDFKMSFRTSADPHTFETICSDVKWGFEFINNLWFRRYEGNNYVSFGCISE